MPSLHNLHNLSVISESSPGFDGRRHVSASRSHTDESHLNTVSTEFSDDENAWMTRFSGLSNAYAGSFVRLV